MANTLLYDADCGFCKLAVRAVLRLDARGKLDTAAIQSPEGQELLRSVPEERRLETAHLHTEDGRLLSGGAAAGPLARLLPVGALPARLFTRFPSATDRTYRWVAGHRTTFGRLGIRTDTAPGRGHETGAPTEDRR